MRIELEQKDIEAIAQKTFELIKPFLSTKAHSDSEVIFDVKGLSEYLKVEPSWVYKKVSLKEIPHFKSGKYVRFKKSAIDRWIESQTRRPIPPLKLTK
ncbi:MAG: helix-turn-helix domain-containing protein [Fervidobacterium sp.]